MFRKAKGGPIMVSGFICACHGAMRVIGGEKAKLEAELPGGFKLPSKMFPGQLSAFTSIEPGPGEGDTVGGKGGAWSRKRKRLLTFSSLCTLAKKAFLRLTIARITGANVRWKRVCNRGQTPFFAPCGALKIQKTCTRALVPICRIGGSLPG